MENMSDDINKHLKGFSQDQRKLIRAALDQGWSLVVKKSGVWLLSPDGTSRAGFHTSESDVRAIRNARAALRRGGFKG
jgi:hypothetical protein